ncbi:hypothetical protein QP179_09870 [Sphingomonas aurantiaca]|uniref:hypothetical protein n=1 Tax=Sphingomonas aurantiaca TaxID=185949 RepID=UPI002FDFAAD8
MEQHIVDELCARADAGQKMGMVAIEMVVLLAKSLNQTIDIRSFAAGMESHPVVDGLDAGDFEIERKSRQRVASILRGMADKVEGIKRDGK